MGVAQIGLGERRDDRAVLFAAGEVDVAHQPAEQARGIDGAALIGHVVERKTRDGQRAAVLLGLLDGAVEIAPESIAAEQPGFRIEHAFGIERFKHALEPALERLHANEGHEPIRQQFGVAFHPHQIG